MKISRYLKTITAIGCAALIALLNGCAGGTGTALKPADRASIRTVSVNSHVSKPDHMTCLDNTRRWKATAAGVVVGGVVTAGIVGSNLSKTAPGGVQLDQAMARNGATVDRIVRDAFTDELRKSGVFAVTTGGGDAQFVLSIRTYGLTVGGNLFDKRLAPNLAVAAELVRADGTHVWKAMRSAISFAGLNRGHPEIIFIGRGQAHQFEEFQNNPQLLKSAFAAAAQVVAQSLIAELKRY